MSTSELDARYGRSPGRRRRNRAIAVLAIAAGALAVGAWAVWAGVLSPRAVLETRTTGYELPADDEAVIRFEVSTTPGATVACALVAQNRQHAIVGWRLVELPPSEEFTRSFEERLVTAEPAVVGLISDCRLT